MVVSLEIKTRRSGQFAIFIKNLKDRTPEATEKIVIEAGQLYLETLEEEIRFFARNPSGNLIDSFRKGTKIFRSGKFSTVRISSNLKYAQIHQIGGTVTAPPGKFFGPIKEGGPGTPRFIKKFTIKPKRYITKAGRRVRPKLAKILKQEVQMLVNGAKR